MYYSLNISGGRLWLESGVKVKDVERTSTQFVFSEPQLLGLKWDIKRLLDQPNDTTMTTVCKEYTR